MSVKGKFHYRLRNLAILSYFFGKDSTIEPFYNVKIVAFFLEKRLLGGVRGEGVCCGVEAEGRGGTGRENKLMSDSYCSYITLKPVQG